MTDPTTTSDQAPHKRVYRNVATHELAVFTQAPNGWRLEPDLDPLPFEIESIERGRRKTASIATVVEILAWLLMALSVVATLYLWSRESVDVDGTSTRPNVDDGLVVLFVGVLQSLIVVMIARYIRSRMSEPYVPLWLPHPDALDT